MSPWPPPGRCSDFVFEFQGMAVTYFVDCSSLRVCLLFLSWFARTYGFGEGDHRGEVSWASCEGRTLSAWLVAAIVSHGALARLAEARWPRFSSAQARVFLRLRQRRAPKQAVPSAAHARWRGVKPRCLQRGSSTSITGAFFCAGDSSLLPFI